MDLLKGLGLDISGFTPAPGTGAGGAGGTGAGGFKQVGWTNGTLEPYNPSHAYAWTAYVSAADFASGNYNTLYADSMGKTLFHPTTFPGLATGGMVPRMKFFSGGNIARGTDTIPAMLTPGEFVVKKYAVDSFGADRLHEINSGIIKRDDFGKDQAEERSAVYNSYELNVHVKSDADPDTIARTVMTKIREVDSQRLRGNKY
jgi:hypothetical protein